MKRFLQQRALKKVCAQVENCAKEMRSTLLYNYAQTDQKDILERFYSTVNKVPKDGASDRIHRDLSRRNLEKNFGTTEKEFSKGI